MRNFDLSPLYRSTVGFDRFASMLDQVLSADTTGQIEDLMTEFWSTDLSAADAQERYADTIASAD